MRLLTAAEQRELDALAAEAGLPTRVLMESAGAAVARVAAAVRPRRGVVFCGPGNNGGDGFVCARWLRGDVADVAVVATAREKLKGAAEEAARAWDGPVLGVAKAPVLGLGDVVIDAVFGSGLSRAPGGAEAAAISAMNEARERGAFVVAVDVPSGADSDRGALYPVHLARADVTVTLHAPKRGLYLHPAAAVAGRIEVASIGIPRALDDKLSAPACELVDEAWGRAFAAPRSATAHKNDFGHVLALAGSPGKSGAAALLVEAALRAGAGLVTLASRPEVLQVALPGVPEAMGWPLPGTGPLGPSDLPSLREAVRGKTALAIGPGIPRGPQTAETIGELLAALDPGCAVVLDADALNAISEHRDRIAEWMRRTPVRPLLTPHPGEFARLSGEEVERVEADRVGSAIRAAQRFGACVVLKGARTVIADPEGTAGICAHGNPGMATAGAGDVLTGIAAAALAQKAGPGGTGERARFAVLLHALAGDLAARRTGEASLVAHDIARTGLPLLFRRWKR